MKLYREVLSQAWQHTIKRPGLWIFGFFATFVFGAAGEFDRYLRLVSSTVADGRLLNGATWLDGGWYQLVVGLGYQLRDGNTLVWGWCILLGVATFIFVVMMSISVGALIHSAEHHTESFTDAFQAGQKHWQQLTWLFISGYIIVIGLTLGISLGLLNWAPSVYLPTAQLIVALLAGFIFLPIVLLASLLLRLAAMAIVLQNKHLGSAISEAWTIFRRHWLVLLEMVLISFIVVGAVSIVVLVGLGLLFLPYFFSLSFSPAADLADKLQNTFLVGQWIYLMLSILSAALVSTWQWTAWTLLFQQLRLNTHTSAAVRWVRSIQ